MKKKQEDEPIVEAEVVKTDAPKKVKKTTPVKTLQIILVDFLITYSFLSNMYPLMYK